MEHGELIQKILTAEYNARQMVQRAREQKASLEASLEQETGSLRSACLERARKRVESMEQEERRQMRLQLERLDREQRSALERADSVLELYGTQWADELFRMAAGEVP